MIESDYFWRIIFALTLGTLAIRGSIIAVSAKVKISNRLKELFSFIPAAILPAILTPMVFFHQGRVQWLYEKERFVVVVLATGICYFTKSMIATIGLGLVALYVVTQI